MLERAQTAGVASGVLIGDSALIVAVVPVGAARRGDSTYLVLAMPLAAQDLQKATGVPVMLSDGTRPISVAGSASQQSALSRLVGREAEGSARDPESTLAGARDRGGSEAVAVGAARDGGRRELRRCSRAARGRGAGAGRGGVCPAPQVGRCGGRRGGRGHGRCWRLGNPGARGAGDGAQDGARAQTSRHAALRHGRGHGPSSHRRSPRAGSRQSAARCPPGAPASRVAPRSCAADALPGARRHQFEHVRPLSPAAAAGRGRHGGALHGGVARRGGLPPGVRRQTPAARGRAQPRRGRAVHRRGEARVEFGAFRTSFPCSTSARSATSTSWRRSTSSAAISGR